MADLNKESMAIWKSLKPMIDEEIKAQTRGSVQRRKMKVTTAPSLVTNVIGVTEPYGTEMLIPFNTNLSAAHIGDVVWVEFMYGATNAFASMYASADTKDFTVGGLLDVVQRRCSAILSSAGWYRVMTFNAPNENEAKGRYVFSIDVTLMDIRMDVHKITLLSTNESLSFVNETSKTSSTQYFTKIRYNYDSSHGYIDVYYAGNNARTMSCFLDVKCEVSRRSLWVSQPFASVANAPAGETVLTTYDFSANGTGDITCNGVLDVVPRRCSATLSSPGWYRVCKIDEANGYVGGNRGTVVDFIITRQTGDSANESHKITLSQIGNGTKFYNEASRSYGTNCIDKIRLTYISGVASYIDIHYNVSSSHAVFVDMNVYGALLMKQFVTAESMQSVADSPSGETISESFQHSFHANSDVAPFKFTVGGKDWWFEKRNGVVYFNSPYDITSVSTGFTDVGTLPVGFRPRIHMYLPCGNNYTQFQMVVISTNGDVKFYTSTATSTARNCAFSSSWVAYS